MGRHQRAARRAARQWRESHVLHRWQSISGNGVDTVKRGRRGPSSPRPTWDHAAGDGQSVNLSYMSAEQQREKHEGFPGNQRRHRTKAKLRDARARRQLLRSMEQCGRPRGCRHWLGLISLTGNDQRQAASQQSLCGSRPAISCSCMMAAETEKLH